MPPSFILIAFPTDHIGSANYVVGVICFDLQQPGCSFGNPLAAETFQVKKAFC